MTAITTATGGHLDIEQMIGDLDALAGRREESERRLRLADLAFHTGALTAEELADITLEVRQFTAISRGYDPPKKRRD